MIVIAIIAIAIIAIAMIAIASNRYKQWQSLERLEAPQSEKKKEKKMSSISPCFWVQIGCKQIGEHSPLFYGVSQVWNNNDEIG